MHGGVDWYWYGDSSQADAADAPLDFRLSLSLVSCSDTHGSQELLVQTLVASVSLGHTRLDQVGCVLAHVQ